jgi:hypothetical protein
MVRIQSQSAKSGSERESISSDLSAGEGSVYAES